MGSILQRRANILERLKKAQTFESCELIAVSKTFPLEAIEEAYESGQRHFGENYVQEASEKIALFAERHSTNEIVWHFIGPIQSNKTRLIAEHFDWVQSVDRLKIAERLNDQRDSSKAPLNILIEVNIDREDQKAGVLPEEVLSFAEKLKAMNSLKLRGLMCIPDPEKNTQTAFQDMRVLFETLQKALPNEAIDTLSMGMSEDFEMAAKEGSTMVRVGRAFFGFRALKPKAEKND